MILLRYPSNGEPLLHGADQVKLDFSLILLSSRITCITSGSVSWKGRHAGQILYFVQILSVESYAIYTRFWLIRHERLCI